MRQATSTAINQRAPKATDSPSLAELEARASHCYEQSQSSRVSNEHSVQYRGQARELAYRILALAPDRAVAHNLLGRIALDEGFYDSAEAHLGHALSQNENDPGCWYSMGHVKLAIGHYDQAVEHFSRALDLAPGETRAATSLVYTFARQGKVTQAFNGYRQLFRVHPDDPHVRAKLFEVARHIQADHYQSDLEADLITWLKLDNVDHDGLARLAASLLRHKYRLDDPDAVIDLQDLAGDELLRLALTRLSFTNADLEGFLKLVRKQLLLHSLAGQFQDTPLLRLAAGFAMQAAHNEYVQAIDDEEQALVQGLRELLETSLAGATPPRPADVTSALLMYGMYEPPHELSGSEALLATANNRWPPHARSMIHHCLATPRAEIRAAADIRRLTPIENPVSRRVRAQYEESPYPRWLHLDYHSPTNYGRALEAELPGFRAPQFFNMGTIRVLVAGAGTGRHALRVAKYFRNVEVTAVDLSARSLAYARRMAERYGISNLRFLQADILELDRLEEDFHVIECSGVLHHMERPEDGLATLRRRLAPHGLIKLGLYSERARRIVVEARDWIDRLGYQPNRDDIRRFRANLLEGRLAGDFDALLDSADFYSTSGCRDLLFHVQEHRFTPEGLAEMIETHDLEFLGFILAADKRENFRREQPAASLTDLAAWDRFEQEHPDTFGGMYQFYARKRV